MREPITYEQAAEILALAAARDQRTVGKADVIAWHDDLNAAGVTFDGAKEALTAFYVEQANVRPESRFRATTPDVIRLARKLRAERVANFVYEPVDPDETVPQFQARMRAQLEAVASGRAPSPPKRLALEGGPAPAVAAAIRGVLRGVPEDDEQDGASSRPQVGAMTVECPRADCKARIGQHCKRPNGKPRSAPHPARVDVANGRPYDPDAERAEMERRRAASAALLANDERPPGANRRAV